MISVVLGYTGSGKTTAARYLSEITSIPFTDTSGVLIKLYCEDKGYDVDTIIENKDEHRQNLYEYGKKLQKEDPSILIKECLDRGSILCGLRRQSELDFLKDSGHNPVVIWIHRDGITKNPTDEIAPSEADIVVNNDGSLDELKKKMGDIANEYYATHNK